MEHQAAGNFVFEMRSMSREQFDQRLRELGDTLTAKVRSAIAAVIQHSAEQSTVVNGKTLRGRPFIIAKTGRMAEIFADLAKSKCDIVTLTGEDSGAMFGDAANSSVSPIMSVYPTHWDVLSDCAEQCVWPIPTA